MSLIILHVPSQRPPTPFLCWWEHHESECGISQHEVGQNTHILWREEQWLSISRKKWKVTMDCKLSWCWQISAVAHKLWMTPFIWYDMEKQNIWKWRINLIFSLCPGVSDCRIHIVKWQDIRRPKESRRKKNGQGKVNMKYLDQLAWWKNPEEWFNNCFLGHKEIYYIEYNVWLTLHKEFTGLLELTGLGLQGEA